MQKTITEIKQLLYAVLAHAPASAECTAEANEMFRDMQALRSSIELFESSGAVVNKDDEIDASDYNQIEDDAAVADAVASATYRYEYGEKESVRMRMTEIQAILENEELHEYEEASLVEEQRLLQKFIDSMTVADE